MEVIKLVHPHFKMVIETSDVSTPYTRAQGRHANFDSCTKYRFPKEANLSVWYNNSDNQLQEVMPESWLHPVMFENRQYQVIVEFDPDVTAPIVRTTIRELETSFTYRKIAGTPAVFGTLNFENDIGSYDLQLSYRYKGEKFETSFGFDVFPIKLDYKTDYRNIVEEIEKAYPQLVFDFLRKTYQNFSPENSKPSNELIWWTIFQGIFKRLVENIRYIIDSPHQRLQTESAWLRPEKIRRINCRLEESVVLNKNLTFKKYNVERKLLKVDTYENRFLKFALHEARRKFNSINQYINKTYANKLSDFYQEELSKMQSTLKVLEANTFFREIGKFEGIKQESLVLQRKAGYAHVLRDWILLKKGYAFFEGATQISFKNIAELYEIWCFLEMKHVLQHLLGVEPSKINLAEIKTDKFRTQLKQGNVSLIAFEKDDGTLVELYHELNYNDFFDKSHKTGTYTVSQVPDIVLRLTKNDLMDNQVFTYLFDAKYRLASDDKNESSVDLPPEDTLNQMHRYRDAIYYEDNNNNFPSKEVIGGYILYPGRDDSGDIKTHGKYYKSIEKINIGAFPLLPGYNESNYLLKDYLAQVLTSQSETLLESAAPQRGKKYQPDNEGVLIAIVGGNKVEAYQEYLTSNKQLELHLYDLPKLLGNNRVKYFAPYIKDKGISMYFSIENFVIAKRNNLYKHHPLLRSEETRPVYVLTLRLIKQFKQFHKLSDGNISTFRYASLYNVRNPRDGKIEPSLRDEL
ncbi:hypothetical protein BH10BAC3_BH10BAC3_11850 [soil metagenome]